MTKFRKFLANRKGTTLVELMMAIVISSILIISIYVVVSGSHKYILNGRNTLKLQQNYSLIESLLSAKIRQAVQAQYGIFTDYDQYIASGVAQDSGSCLKLILSSGDSCIIYKDDSNFKIINSDLSVTNLVQGMLTNLAFSTVNNGIQTQLSVNLGTTTIQNVLMDAFRNSGAGGLGNRKCELVIQSSKVPGTLTDFPLLLTNDSLPSEMFDSDGSYPALNGGGDVRFSSDAAGQTQLACEIVTFATNTNPAKGSGEVWVNVPSISSSSNTSIWVWYYNPGQSQPAEDGSYGSEAVWDSKYQMVLHMNEDPSTSAPQFQDATNNDYNGTNNGGLSGSDLEDCVIGKGIDFDGSSNDDIDLGIWDVTGSGLTVQHWFYIDASPSVDGRFFSRATGTDVSQHWLMTGINAGDVKPRFRLRTDGSTKSIEESGISEETWHFMAATYDGSKMRIWIDTQNIANEDKSGTISTSASVHNYLGDNPSGSRQLQGKLDEVRVSTVRRSDNWLEAEYNNQNSPATFVVEGAPESP